MAIDQDSGQHGLSADWDRQERLLEAFEEAWQRGEHPAIEDYLSQGEGGQDLLADFIRADLECRLKVGEAARVEAYLERYTELARNQDLIVDLLWAEFSFRRSREPAVTLQEYLGRFPQYHAELLSRFAATDPLPNVTPAPTVIDQRDPQLPPTGDEGNDSRPAERGAAPLRYRPVRFHAKGALGEIQVAEDRELHREVALKRIQAQHAQDEDSRQRFLREAEVTARLEHPGVVPVHGLVYDADGQPCYAMRFIQGETFQEAIDRFHESDQPGHDAGERRLALRGLVTRFVAVCNTVAYAHSRGILHRDLKPANIMLGKYGETLVVDWGLAKHFERDDTARASGEQTLTPQSAAGGKGTEVGDVCGTPAYMSPEQADGDWDVVGPASDIYSLGASLYVLLTGQVAFSGNGRQVLQRVRRGEFLRPQERKKEVPAALAAICLKAMALKTEERYTTALDLARDLERWLADEPVLAWREPWSVRSRRWLNKHRTLVASGVVGLVVAVGVLLPFTALLTVANRELRQANESEQQAQMDVAQQRKEARDNFTLARQTVEEYCIKVNENLKLRAEDMTALRKELLQSAVGFQEKLTQNRSTDPEAQADRAEAYFQLAVLSKETGPLEEAIRNYEQARTAWEQLAESQPPSSHELTHLADCYHSLAECYRKANRISDAERAFREALSISRQLVSGSPDDRKHQLGLAGITFSLGGFYYYAKHKVSEAEKDYQDALTIVESVLKVDPQDLAAKSAKASYLYELAWLYDESDRKVQAEDTYSQALAIQQNLAEVAPDNRKYQEALSNTLDGMGILYRRIGQLDKSEKSYLAALKVRKNLAERNPSLTAYQQNLSDSYNNLGVCPSNHPPLPQDGQNAAGQRQ